jgi:hypothetical protein
MYVSSKIRHVARADTFIDGVIICNDYTHIIIKGRISFFANSSSISRISARHNYPHKWSLLEGN